MAQLIRLVVDTDSYTGNFERELCAYVTGQYGECTVGRDYVECFASQIKHLDWWNKHIVQRAEPRPALSCKRPVAIYLNESDNYNSLAISVNETPSEEVLAEFVVRVKDFCDNQAALKKTIHDEKVKNNKVFYSMASIPDAYSPIVLKGIRIFKGAKNPVLVSGFEL